MLVDASDELESIEGEDRLSVEVAEVRMLLHAEAKQWDLAAATECQVALAKPSEPYGWIAWAYAARRLVSIASAEAILLNAEPRIGATCAILHFNLACYRCQQGDIEGAKKRLATAYKLDPEAKKMASEEPDLKPMWAAIAEMK